MELVNFINHALGFIQHLRILNVWIMDTKYVGKEVHVVMSVSRVYVRDVL